MKKRTAKKKITPKALSFKPSKRMQTALKALVDSNPEGKLPELNMTATEVSQRIAEKNGGIADGQLHVYGRSPGMEALGDLKIYEDAARSFGFLSTEEVGARREAKRRQNDLKFLTGAIVFNTFLIAVALGLLIASFLRA